MIDEVIDSITANYEFNHPKKIQIFLLLLRLKKIVENNPIK